MSNRRLTRRISSFSAFSTSANKFMTYLTEPMLSTSNNMIKIRCYTTSRWATKCGYIRRRNASLDPTKNFAHFDMGRNHHQGYRGQCLWAQFSTIPWSAPSVQCGPPSAILPTYTGHLWRFRTTHTNRVKPILHGTSHNLLDQET